MSPGFGCQGCLSKVQSAVSWHLYFISPFHNLFIMCVLLPQARTTWKYTTLPSRLWSGSLTLSGRKMPATWRWWCPLDCPLDSPWDCPFYCRTVFSILSIRFSIRFSISTLSAAIVGTACAVGGVLVSSRRSVIDKSCELGRLLG